jgi:hypothetical protein
MAIRPLPMIGAHQFAKERVRAALVQVREDLGGRSGKARSTAGRKPESKGTTAKFCVSAGTRVTEDGGIAIPKQQVAQEWHVPFA